MPTDLYCVGFAAIAVLLYVVWIAYDYFVAA
jgi:hypothetical protein